MTDLYNDKLKKRIEILKEKIASLDRVKLGSLPTPLQRLDNITNKFSGPDVYIKRDDLTGLGMGGNKIRMLEFTIAKALKEGADSVIGTASVQSNYCRQLSAAAAKVDMETFLVLKKVRGERDLALQGNYFLDYILGAETEIIDPLSWEELVNKIKSLKEELIEKGKSPYIMRAVNVEDNWLDSIGYVNCFIELINQFKKREIIPDYIFVTGSDTTQAGLSFAQKYLEFPVEIIGFSPTPKTPGRPVGGKNSIKRIIERISEEFSLDITMPKDEINLHYDYVGKDYGIPTKMCREAINIMAGSESIFLDPVYSGKGFSGVINYIRRGKINDDETILFLHTGGAPSLFAYTDELSEES